MSNVFVSHVEEDRKLAIEIAGALEAAGMTTWYYERDSLPGPTYLTHIADAIEASKVMLVLVSAASMGSHQVSKEIEYAHNAGVPFLPVLADVSHKDFEHRRKDWNLMFGAATSIQVEANLGFVLSRIAEGARQLLGVDAPSPIKKAPVYHEPNWSKFVELMRFRAHKAYVHSLMFSPDGKRIVSGDGELNVPGTAIIWDATSGKKIVTFASPNRFNRVAFSWDGKRVVTTSEDETLRVWDAWCGNLLFKIKGSFWFAAFSPDGKQIAAGWDGVHVLDAATGASRLILRGHSDCVSAIAYSPNGRCIASASWDKMVRIWSSSDGGLLKVLHGHGSRINSVAYSSDGSRILTCSGNKDALFNRDSSVRIWDAVSGTEIAMMELPKNQNPTAVFTPTGKCIVHRFSSDTAIYDVTMGKILAVLKPKNDSGLFSFASSFDGRRVAVVEGTEVVIWGEPD